MALSADCISKHIERFLPFVTSGRFVVYVYFIATEKSLIYSPARREVSFVPYHPFNITPLPFSSPACLARVCSSPRGERGRPLSHPPTTLSKVHASVCCRLVVLLVRVAAFFFPHPPHYT